MGAGFLVFNFSRLVAVDVEFELQILGLDN